MKELLYRSLVKAAKLLKPDRRKNFLAVSDEYMEWLCFAVPGMMERGNLYCFDHVVKNLASEAPILEIGSFCGLSTCAIAYYLQKHGKRNKIICCDKWVFEGAEKGGTVGNSVISHDEYRLFVRGSFVRNIKTFCKSAAVYAIEQSSDDFFELWFSGTASESLFGGKITLGGKISFCFIDGMHTYEQSKKDFENADQILERGGFILFDDSSASSPFGCAKVAQEVLRADNYNLVTTNPNYFFQKK